MHFQTNEWTEVAFVFLPSNDKHRPHQYRSFFLGCFRFQFKVFIFSSFFLHFWIVRDILVPKYEQNDYVQGFGAWIFQEHQSNREQVRFEIQIINNFFFACWGIHWISEQSKMKNLLFILNFRKGLPHHFHKMNPRMTDVLGKISNGSYHHCRCHWIARVTHSKRCQSNQSEPMMDFAWVYRLTPCSLASKLKMIADKYFLPSTRAQSQTLAKFAWIERGCIDSVYRNYVKYCTV